MYVPLRGEHFDGHAFIDSALSAGAGGYLFDEAAPFGPAAHPGKPCIRVTDTRRALGVMARGWRSRFNLPVLAVLGSNGKTTVKEMLAAIVREAVGEAATLATRGNLNNDIGLPQTVFRLRAEHRMAVLELGMNHPGEIDWLCEIAQPQIAVMTNAQREHQAFLDGVEATAHENGAAFTHLPADGVAVYPGDDACAAIWAKLAGDRRTVTFGHAQSAGQFDVWASAQAVPSGFELNIGTQALSVTLLIEGAHNIRNALAAAAAAHAGGIAPTAIAAGLAAFEPAKGRLRRARSAADVFLIDDTYNANPDSVRAAIDVLAARPEPRVLVLGEMGELGENEAAWHTEVGQYARERGLTTLLGLGELTVHAVQAFGAGGQLCADHDEISRRAAELLQPGVSMLVKGSRYMKMEAVIAAIETSDEAN